MIAVSEFCADEVTTHTAIPRDRIRVVPNGVDRERATAEAVAKARLDLRDRRPAVRVLGRHLPAPQERPRAARRVQPPRPRGRAASAGARGSARVEARRRRRRGGGRAGRPASVCSGPCTASSCSRCSPGADLYALPSLHEGFGIPALEAMAQETPVLCSDIPALREVAGDAARFVPRRHRRVGRPRSTTLLGDAAARAAWSAAGTRACRELLVGTVRARDGRGVPRGAQRVSTSSTRRR